MPPNASEANAFEITVAAPLRFLASALLYFDQPHRRLPPHHQRPHHHTTTTTTANTNTNTTTQHVRPEMLRQQQSANPRGPPRDWTSRRAAHGVGRPTANGRRGGNGVAGCCLASSSDRVRGHEVAGVFGSLRGWLAAFGVFAAASCGGGVGEHRDGELGLGPARVWTGDSLAGKLAAGEAEKLVRIVLGGPPHRWMNDFDQRPTIIFRHDIRRSHRPKMDTGMMLSPRRKRDVTSNGISNWKRTSSLNSSNSSDILVAGPQSHTTPTHAEQQDSFRTAATWPNALSMANLTRTSVVDGRYLTIRFTSDAAKKTLRNIDKVQPRPLSIASRTVSAYSRDVEEDDDVQDGPNHRGTYSKQYTLEHPEIKFVHRGQGRYVRVADVKPDVPTVSPRSTRQAAPERLTVATSVSNEVLSEMYLMLDKCFDAHRRKINPTCKDNWSPMQKGQFTALWTLIKQTPRDQWPTLPERAKQTGHSEVVSNFIQAVDQRFPQEGASDSRSRLTRQAKTTSYVEQRRSTRPRASANNVFDSEEEADEDSEEQQDSDHDDHNPPRLDPNSTVHADDLHLYPGQAFHHTGNRFYRPGIGPHGAHGSIAITRNGIKRKYSDYIEEEKAAREDDEMSETADAGGTFSKEYVQRHPEIEFVHRGKGRYRRKSDIGTSSTTPVASSERRLSRVDNSLITDYAESHVSDEFMRSGRAKRNSRANIALDEAGDGLYDKKYVDSHPNELFHHRGQGRYARGPRNIRAPAPKEEAPPPAPVSEPGVEELVSSSFVDAHPNETFHHRGQGKWARGLPPPGSSNKTAVRGPGRDGGIEDEVDADGNRPPGPTALVLRTEGPDKWPHLRWVYRGGGKWCRQTKEEIQKATMPPAGPRRSRTSVYLRARNNGAEAQLQRETLEAEESTGGSPWKGKENVDDELSRPTKAVRRRGQRSGPTNGESKVSSNSQSKAPTPRPALLSPEEDILTEIDFPTLYKDDWTLEDLGGNTDQASRIQQRKYRSIVGPEPYVTALTKHDPAIRSLGNLKLIAANAQKALLELQTEYLELDKIVAIHPMNGKKERKPVKGGRQTVEPAVFEDRKEALLYDYTFDPRKIGFQDPEAQRIVRDDEGRELRRRRNRIGADNSLPNGVNYGDGEMTAKRTVKPVSRFDGVVVQASRKRPRLSNAPGSVTGETASPAPSRAETAVAAEPEVKRTGRQQRGRQPEHVPKRIRELRHESVPSTRSASEESSSRVGASVADSTAPTISDNANGGGGMSMNAILNPAPAPHNNSFTNPLNGITYPDPNHDILDIRHLSPLPPLSPSAASGTAPGSAASSVHSSFLSSSVRKGRPPGSKNLHKRRDAGIKKGPRKPKVAMGGEEESGGAGSVEPEGERAGFEDDGDGDVVMGGGESPTPMTMGAGQMQRMS